MSIAVATSVILRPDPARVLRPRLHTQGYRTVLKGLREETDFSAEMSIASEDFVPRSKRLFQAAIELAAMPVATRKYAQYTDPAALPEVWIGDGAPTTMLADTPLNAERNRVWKIATHYWGRVRAAWSRDNLLAIVKTRREIIGEQLDTLVEDFSAQMKAVTGVWADFYDTLPPFKIFEDRVHRPLVLG